MATKTSLTDIGVSQELYPFTSHYLTLNGHHYHYLNEGSGDPVLMVHGNPTWSFYYRNLVKLLSVNSQAIVPDHMGCGLSDKPSDDKYDYTLESRISDLNALLNHLQIEKPITLIVHDWGGAIGLHYAVSNPEKIKQIILFNTGAFHLPNNKKLPWQLKLVRNTQLGSFLVRGLNAFSLLASFVAVKKPLASNVRKAFCAPYNNWQNRRATLRFVQDIPLQETDEAYDVISYIESNLSKLASKPILVCWGMQDFVFDYHFLKRWKIIFPNATFHEFAKAGHYVLEDEWDSIEKLVGDFLELKH